MILILMKFNYAHMILVDRYVPFLVENKITQEQFLFLELIYFKRIDLIKLYKQGFPTTEGGMISKALLDDLIKREYIIKTMTGLKLGYNYLKIYVTPDKAVDEIFDLYPTFILSEQGVQIPLTAMDKKIFR